MISPRVFSIGASLAAASSSLAQVLTPAALSTSDDTHPLGSVLAGELTVIADSFVPPEGTPWADPVNYAWEATPGGWVQLDFGGLVTLGAVRASVDNNDSYAFATSTDGLSFAPLFTFAATDGNIDAGNPGGMDTMSTLAGAVDFITGTSFSPVSTRYLRVTAAAGDNLFSVGEVLAWGEVLPAIPEPATWSAALGVMAAVVALRRRKAAR